MRAVVQRVSSSEVRVDGQVVGKIGKGLNVLVGITHSDDEKDINYILDKVVNLRIFEDENGKMNLSVKDTGGEILFVSQFTLYGDVRGGRRPSYTQAMAYDEAEKLYNKFLDTAKEKGIEFQCGKYGADMKVEINNDGPVTILIDSKKEF
ncbi:MAG: D-tyrosyl-tRNA(Tyr) deacylase [Anaerofustis stercorihominis]|nr:D-tyrosyl-tRNA(Tyr) deacylase [Anaerofustis stercorihominis]